MIDIQNEVFDRLTTALKAFDSNVGTSSVYVNIPTVYPFVSIEEIENSVYTNGIDSCKKENFADITYEINVYTKGTTKKSDCRKLLAVVDNYMSNVGFIRNSVTPMQDQNETLYRIVARYSGVVGIDNKVYRR